MPISSPVSSKIVFAPASTSRSNATPIAGFAVRPDVASEPPQIVPTVSSSTRIGTVGCAARRGSVCVDPRAAVGDRLARAAGATGCRASCTGRPDASIGAREPALVEAFAAERDEQRAADVRMRAELLHHRRARSRSDSSRESRSGGRRARESARRSRARRGARTRRDRRRPARCGCPCGRRRAGSPCSVGEVFVMSGGQRVRRQVAALDVVRVNVRARRDRAAWRGRSGSCT